MTRRSKMVKAFYCYVAVLLIIITLTHAITNTVGLALKRYGFSRSHDIQTRIFDSGASTAYCGYGDETNCATKLSSDKRTTDRRPPRLIPLSKPPLLLLQSSNPIISIEYCALISRYFEHLMGNNVNASQMDKTEIQAAETILQDVHDIVDTMTNCPRHDGEVQLPRYVRYDTTFVAGENMMQNPKLFMNALLPDGLHVDTNNGKLFRHITAILYLTDNHDIGSSIVHDDINGVLGGGTTFPLAIPIDQQYNHNDVLLEAAKRLLNCGIHHTKGDVNENDNSFGRIVEKAALDVFFREELRNELNIENQSNNYEKNTKGLRVMPEAGKLIYFHNVDDDGLPDHMSFHGGEELVSLYPDSALAGPSLMPAAKTKSILVFFKEIPLESFVADGRLGFAKQASKARSWTKKMYY